MHYVRTATNYEAKVLNFKSEFFVKYDYYFFFLVSLILVNFSGESFINCRPPPLYN